MAVASGFNSWAFNQLNQLTPDQSPANGTANDSERNDSSLSFPVSGEALQAQLEAWTSVAFDFGSDAVVSPKDKDSDDAATIGPSYGIDNYALGFAQDGSFLDPLALNHDPYGAGLYAFGTPADQTLHLPPISTPSTSSTSLPPLPVAVSGVIPASTNAGSSAVAQAAPAKGGKAAAAKKRKAEGEPGAVKDLTPKPGMTDEELNSLAVEEDKRRRNTAASARFRIKKKQREAALESTAKELRDRVNTLEREVEALRTENGWLRGLIVGKEAEDRLKAEEESKSIVV